MASHEQKKREAALERILGPAGEDGPHAPSGRGDHELDAALARRLDALRDDAGLSAEQKETAWENIMHRRSEAPPLGAPDMSTLPERNQVSFFQRPVLMITAVAAALFLAFGIYNIYQKGRAGLPGRIIETAGDVRINNRPARKGDQVLPGDRIRTGSKSHFVLVVNGKNAFRGLAHSELVYRIRPGRARLDIKAGYLAAYVGNRKGMGPLSITTPHATAHVRGTTLFMGLPKKSRTYFCICNGKVHLEPRRTPGGAGPHPMEASHHAAAVFEHGKSSADKPGMIKESKGGMLLHTDAMLEKLAGAVNETIDWSRVENHAPPGPR